MAGTAAPTRRPRSSYRFLITNAPLEATMRAFARDS